MEYTIHTDVRGDSEQKIVSCLRLIETSLSGIVSRVYSRKTASSALERVIELEYYGHQIRLVVVPFVPFPPDNVSYSVLLEDLLELVRVITEPLSDMSLYIKDGTPKELIADIRLEKGV